MIETMEFMWFVGLFEGEGCISYSDVKRRGTTAAHLTIGSTDRDVIERVVALHGGVIHTHAGTNKPMHCWRLNRRCEVLSLLHRMLPYLSARRASKAVEVIDNLEAFVASGKARTRGDRCELQQHSANP